MTAYESQNSKNDNSCVAEIVIMRRKNHQALEFLKWKMTIYVSCDERSYSK